MRKLFFTYLLFVCAVTMVSAQEKVVQNRPYTDLRPFHFGILVGTHLQDIEFDNIVCDKVDVSVLGSGDVKLKNVKTLQSVNEVVGSGDIKIHYDNSGNVESTIVGSGDITLSGQVKRSTYEIRGSGDMNTGNLIVKN